MIAVTRRGRAFTASLRRRCPRNARLRWCFGWAAFAAGLVASPGYSQTIAAWPSGNAGQTCGSLFAETGTEPRRLHLHRRVLRFWEAQPDPAAGREESPVLFVHGYNGDLCDFGPLLVAMARERHVVAFDLPSFGESTGADDTIESYVHLVGELVARLRLGRVHLVCHSMGGQVCIGVGLTSPSFVESITLIDAAGVYDPASFPGQVGKKMAQVNVGAMAVAKGRTLLDLLDRNRIVARHLGADNPATWTAMSSFQSSYRGDVHNLALPVLIVWGREDPIFSIDSACLLKENIRGSVLHVIEGAGHSPQRSHPAETLRFIDHFLSRIEQAGRAPSTRKAVEP